LFLKIQQRIFSYLHKIKLGKSKNYYKNSSQNNQKTLFKNTTPIKNRGVTKK